MKKILYLVLPMVLIIGLAACGQGTSDDTDEEKTKLGTEPEQTEVIDEEKEEETETNKQTNEQSSNATNEVETLDTINLYYSDSNLMAIYRVEVEANLPKDEEGIKNALQLWISGPDHEGLQGLVPTDVTVQSVTNKDGIAHISFSEELLKANVGSPGEAALIEQLAMVVEQFGYDKLFILIDGEKTTDFLGHVGLSETEPVPIEKSPEDYELYQE